MEVDIKKGIDDTINSKIQIFHQKTRNDLVLFEKNRFPRILNSRYDFLLFSLINCAFISKNRINQFYEIIEPYVEFNMDREVYELENIKITELKKDLINTKIFSGISMLEIQPKNTENEHLNFIQEMGGKLISIPVKESDVALDLDNFAEKNKEKSESTKYDLTFSNSLLHDESGIEDTKKSNVYRSMELYTIFSNLTKKSGFSLHFHGAYISSLYETFFQFLGFRAMDYFRFENGDYNFGFIMKKNNNKEIGKQEFDYLYREMKKRNPIRYR